MLASPISCSIAQRVVFVSSTRESTFTLPLWYLSYGLRSVDVKVWTSRKLVRQYSSFQAFLNQGVHKFERSVSLSVREYVEKLSYFRGLTVGSWECTLKFGTDTKINRFFSCRSRCRPLSFSAMFCLSWSSVWSLSETSLKILQTSLGLSSDQLLARTLVGSLLELCVFKDGVSESTERLKLQPFRVSSVLLKVWP